MPRKAADDISVLEKAAQLTTIRGMWRLYVQVLDRDFFASREARLQLTEQTSKGTPAYQGLSITEKK